MFNFFSSTMLSGVSYIKKHPQLIMTITLVVVIPIAFVVSGEQFLSAARENQEQLEKDRIGLMHDMFASYLTAVNFEPNLIQQELKSLSRLNPDITNFKVVVETPAGLQIIASLDPAYNGTIVDNPNPYRIANTNPNESLLIPYAQNGIRYWQSFRLIQISGLADHYIFTENSLAHIDEMFASRIMKAYYWLVGLLLIILLLLFRHVRLIDYAHLYSETKKANEVKDLFTNMIAHELRAPLTAMRGYASMIDERSFVDDETRRNASNIRQAAERLLLIVNDLLDVARIQSGKLSVTKEPVELSKVVLAVIEEMNSVASEKQVTLGAEGVHGDIVITGDEKRLHQALTNLVSNAIKYTEKGSINVSLDKRRDRVELRVKDTGMGISSENQKQLFAPFFRVEGEATKAITGTGLGMWITKQLIELMGGSIGVESIKGVGTHVVVTLPVGN